MTVQEVTVWYCAKCEVAHELTDEQVKAQKFACANGEPGNWCGAPLERKTMRVDTPPRPAPSSFCPTCLWSTDERVAATNRERRAQLRDTFAAAALTGLLSSSNWGSIFDVSERAYRIADAMLSERALAPKKEPEPEPTP